jgi:dephospho-CoA kinase
VSDFVVGLTGGVASGKSTLASAFEALGVVVVDADVAAREAVAVGSAGLQAVVEAFGPAVLSPDGALDRAAMRQRVFSDDAARKRLEAIIHPRVRTVLEQSCAAASGPYAIAAIPLLAEGGGRDAYPWLDRILVVDVPAELQVARLLARDGIDDALARRMVAAQASREARLAIADDVVVNDGPLERLAEAARALDGRYRALAASADNRSRA